MATASAFQTLTVQGLYDDSANPLYAAPGAAIPSSALFIGGSDGTDIRALHTDTSGNLFAAQTGTWTVATNADASIGAGTAPAKALIVGAVYNSAAPTPSSGQTLALQLDSSGNLNVNVKAGSSGNAAASATGSAVPADADYLGVNVGGTLRGVTGVNPSGVVYAVQMDVTAVGGATAVTVASGVLKVGIVGNAGGAVDAVQGATAPANVLVTGGVFNTALPTISSGDVSAAQLDAKGQQLIDINYVLGALHSKTNPLYTSITDGTNSLTAALSAWGTAPTGTEVMGVNANLFINGVISVAASAGVQKVGISGATGAALDSTIGAATAPANAIATSGVYNSAPSTLTNGQAIAVQVDTNGNQKGMPGIAPQTLAAWTTAGGATTAVLAVNTGAPAIIVQLDQNSSITGGSVTWQGTYDGFPNWVTIPAQQVLDPTSATFAQIGNPYTLQASVNKPFLILMGGYQQIRANLTSITGTGGSVTPYVTQLAYSPIAEGPTSGSSTVSGGLTNNNAAPTSNNLGVLPALAQTSLPTYTNGDQVLLVTDLKGNLNTDLQYYVGAALGAGANFGTSPGAVVSMNANASLFIGTTVASAATAGVQLVGIEGHAGGVLDAAQGAAAPANVLSIGGVFNTSLPTISTGDISALQIDAKGQLFVDLNYYAGTALGAAANFGTTPGAVAVGGVNASLFIGTVAAVAAASGVQKVGIVGNAGGIVDAVLGAATPANAILVAGSDGTDLRALNVTSKGTQLIQDAVDASASSINFFAADSGATPLSISGSTPVPVVSIRANSSSIIFRLRGIDVFTNGAMARFQIIRNGTLTGASFATVPSTNMQVDTVATGISSGTVVDSGYVGDQKARDKQLAIYIAPGATGDILSLVMVSLAGASAKVSASFQWSEQAAVL